MFLAYSTSKEMSFSSFQNKAVKTIMMSAAADVMYTSRANMVAACPNIKFLKAPPDLHCSDFEGR